MKKLVAKIQNQSIYHKIVNDNNYWNVEDENCKSTHVLCTSFDQAVKYACENLKLIEYLKD
jgi:hypothetical protein